MFVGRPDKQYNVCIERGGGGTAGNLFCNDQYYRICSRSDKFCCCMSSTLV
jgi:hypothetical protein